MLLSIGALAAKTATASLPAVLLVLLWWKEGRLEWRDVASTLPLFLAAAAMGSTTLWLEKHHVGAIGADWSMPLVDNFILAGRLLWFYAGKLVWPAHLTFFYPRWQLDSGQFWQYAFTVSAAAVLLGLFLLRHCIGRGPFAAALVFVLALAPASGFFNVFFMRYSFVQDHFQYHVSLALIALFAAALTQALRRLVPVAGPATTPCIAVPATVLIALGGLSWGQGSIYKDSETVRGSCLSTRSFVPRFLHAGLTVRRSAVPFGCCDQLPEGLPSSDDVRFLSHNSRHEKGPSIWLNEVAETDHQREDPYGHDRVYTKARESHSD